MNWTEFEGYIHEHFKDAKIYANHERGEFCAVTPKGTKISANKTDFNILIPTYQR